MKGKTFTIFILFVMMSNLLVSQSIIYLDENIKMIDSVQFANKCKNRILKCLEYSKDTLTIKKVLPKHSFGKINTDEFNQIRLIFEKKTNKKISNKNSLLIVYKDTLFSYNEAKEKYQNYIAEIKEEIAKKPQTIFVRIRMNNGFRFSKFPLYDFDTFHAKRNKLLEKCRKKIEKKSTSSLFYVFNSSKKEGTDFRKIDWIKDTGIFKNKFFTIIGNYRILILKPSGDYFLSDGYLSNEKLNSLLKNDDWSQYINDLKKSLNSNSVYGFGFFDTYTYNKHSKYCF